MRMIGLSRSAGRKITEVGEVGSGDEEEVEGSEEAEEVGIGEGEAISQKQLTPKP
jgi:hypothetical protein